MIQFEQVSKYYKPDIVALKDISFEVDEGEFMFIVGPSGAGKSTVIRLLIRQEKPSEGNIMFEDIDVVRLARPSLPIYRQQIGVVFQDYKLIENKTIEENIKFALEITGKTDQEVQETTDSLLDAVKLANRADLFPPQLSGGEKQRASIARALANDPKLLIADEPTGNLDPDTSHEIISILEMINSWGTTIMIATHDKEIVDEMNKRVVRMEDGEIISDHIGKYDPDSTQKTKKQKDKNQKKNKEQKPKETKEEKATDIGKLGLNKRLTQALRQNEIHTIEKLLDYSESDLDAMKKIGRKGAKKIIEHLESYIKNQTQV